MYQFDINKIQDYLEGLSQRNKDVQHNVLGNKSFARFESGEAVAEIRKNAGKNIVVVASISGQRVGEKDDRILQREVVLRFAVFADKNIDATDGKKTALQKSEEIMFDFMTEMERQQEYDLDNDICSVMHGLQPQNFAWQEIEEQPWLINHYGWDLTVPFKVYMPKHNTAKWI